MSDRAAFRADVARSARLLRAFRTEQAAPDAYYAGLARDTACQLSQYLDLAGRVVADVGGGPGYFAREFRKAGARAVCLDTNLGELASLGRPEPGSVIGSALRQLQVQFAKRRAAFYEIVHNMIEEGVIAHGCLP